MTGLEEVGYDWRPAVLPPTDAALLNDSQRRHLGVTLSHMQRLLHEIVALLNTPAPRDGLLTELRAVTR